MESFNEYIKGFGSGVKSLLIGMRTSMKVFWQPKVTEQYPENRHTTLHIPERHRAMLVMPHDSENHHHCVACGLCQMACPNGTIKVTSETREDEDGNRLKIWRPFLCQNFLIWAFLPTLLPAVRKCLSPRSNPVHQ